jgi:acyl carrier protein
LSAFKIGSNRKENAMDSSSRALVHHLLASQLQVDEASIDDAHRFEELGLDPLHIVLVVLRLEDFDRGNGDFPVDALDHATTVGDLVALVDRWLHGDTRPTLIEGMGP